MQESPYNPLDKRRLAESVTSALLKRKVVPLGSLVQFNGAGIYVIYYTGDFPAYKEISESNKDNQFKTPIYVGKAVPAGARKGGFGLDASQGYPLFKRLSEHAESVDQVSNLKLEHFYCRYLVVDDIWIPLAESLLIEMFSPVWNKVVDGFGNHDPGSGRSNQQRSRWDMIHPGRGWAEKLKENKESVDVILQNVRKHLDRPHPL
jgi:hypothetical protein